MTSLKFRFIGWMKDEQENHDKVWVAIKIGDYGKVLTCWGRRGKKLQTKITQNDWDLSKLIRSKENKGYKSVDENCLAEVYPEFEADLEKTAMWQMLMM